MAIYPNRTEVKVDQMWSDDIEVTKVGCGENVKVKLKGVDESGVTPGFVLCDPTNPIKSCRIFDAQVRKMVFFMLRLVTMAPIFFAFSFFAKNEEFAAIFREKRKKNEKKSYL